MNHRVLNQHHDLPYCESRTEGWHTLQTTLTFVRHMNNGKAAIHQIHVQAFLCQLVTCVLSDTLFGA